MKREDALKIARSPEGGAWAACDPDKVTRLLMLINEVEKTTWGKANETIQKLTKGYDPRLEDMPPS
jgi:hypothetical protein